jgi:hypothetical protein
VLAATGAIVAPGVNLRDAATAMATARSALTRRLLVERLRDALAKVAGYPAEPESDEERARVEADVERFVVGPILRGGTLATLLRPDRPPTRGEANQLVACGIGLTPATETRVETYPAAGSGLITPLARGGPSPERFLVPSEWDDALERIAALRPEEVYRTGDITLADHGFRPLPSLPWRDLAFVLPHGTPVRIVAPTFGAAWDLGLEDLELSIADDGCFRETLDAAVREPDWVGSVPWVLDLPDRGPGLQRYVLSLSGRHRDEGWTLVGRRWIEVEVTGRT